MPSIQSEIAYPSPRRHSLSLLFLALSLKSLDDLTGRMKAHHIRLGPLPQETPADTWLSFGWLSGFCLSCIVRITSGLKNKLAKQ